jgi:hypothetical protein
MLESEKEDVSGMNTTWTRPGHQMNQAIWIRLALALVLLAYIAFMLGSRLIPLPAFFTFPLALTGWLFPLGLFLLAKVRRIDTRPSAQPPIRDLLRPWALTAAFGAFAAAALFLSVGWDVPGVCHGPVPLNCFQEYQWSTDDGHYYQTILEGPRAEISRQTYISEVGFDLRSAADFGVLALCAAWTVAGVFKRASTGPAS